MKVIGQRWTIAFFLVLSAWAFSASAARERWIANGDGTRTDSRTGLVWVADPEFAVAIGFADSALMPRAQALELIAAMNAGTLENFGIRQWRLPSLDELAEARALGLSRRELAAALGRSDLKAEPMAIGWPVKAGGAPDGFAAVAVFATNSVWLKQSSDVFSGSVIVNAPSAGPYLSDGAELSVGLGVTTPPGFELKADSIKIKSSAVVACDDPGQDGICDNVFCNDLDDGSGAVTCTALGTDPVFGSLPPFVQAPPREDAVDVTVAVGGSVTLPAGDYGILQYKKNSTVTLTGGIYNFAEIDGGISADLLFEGAAEVRVAGKLDTDQNSVIGPAPGAGISASDVVFYVAGVNGNNGNLGATPKAAQIGLSTIAAANFYVPNGTLWLRQGSVSTGAFLARDVIVGISAEVHLDSFFGNRPPVADPQAVTTAGADPIDILLTGSDPEDGDLTFSIEVDPTAGSLSDPTPIVPAPIPEIDPETGLPTGGTVQPPIVSATVTYTPATGDDVTDSFTFKVADPEAATGTANVLINPGLCDDGSPPPCDPPPAVTTVVALGTTAETRRGTAVTITLAAEAPCDGACDGSGADGDVPLTFAIVGGTPSTTANGGTVDGLAQGAEVPRRRATVTYTPADGFVSPPLDSFDFEVCGLIAAVEVCDVATVTVEVSGPTLLAEDVEGEVEAGAVLDLTLVGNPGGVGDAGKASPARALAALKAVGLAEAGAVGAVVDVDFDGFGDQVVAGSGGFADGTDFESPVLAASEGSRLIDPYVFGDTVIGIDGGGGTFVVGLVKNSATSACVDPPSDDQKLGIGTTAPGSIGFASAAVRATFPEPLPAGTEVSVDFQTALGTPIRLRLFDAGDQPVGAASATASPAAGQCGLPGPARARTTLTATATGSAAYAVMDLDTSTGGVVFVLDDLSFTTGGTVSAGLDFPDSGERRIQVEWDVSGFPIASSLVSATVTMHTVKGADDTLDTSFFAGTAEQDAAVTPSDFEASASAVAGAVMPVPADPAGTEGTFTFDVLNALVAALGGDTPLDVFSIQGRVDLESVGQGLQVRTDLPPTLLFATPPPIPPSQLVFTVLSAPTLGTLFTSTGSPVVVGEALPSPDLTYVGGTVGGLDSFTYQVEEFGIVGTAVVVIAVNDGCVEVGRPPGCSPGN